MAIQYKFLPNRNHIVWLTQKSKLADGFPYRKSLRDNIYDSKIIILEIVERSGTFRLSRPARHVYSCEAGGLVGACGAELSSNNNGRIYVRLGGFCTLTIRPTNISNIH
ncbi:MAG: hypothetical protein KKF20_05920 [Bacteroidetes bacterium]|nr:hypothetical protein [Bacteroidota bacterium]